MTLLTKKRDMQGAIEASTAALVVSPRHSDLLFLRGYASFQIDDLEAADKDFEACQVSGLQV
jgi:hypothetical protein